MLLGLSLTTELATCIAAWSLIGRLIRGDQSAVVSEHVSSLSWQVTQMSEGLVGIAFALVMVYWVPVLAATVYDLRMRSKIIQPPYFQRSTFYIGLFALFTVIKALLVVLTLVLLSYPAADLSAATANQLFKTDFMEATVFQEASSVLASAQTALIVWLAIHAIDLFGAAYNLGAEHTARKNK